MSTLIAPRTWGFQLLVLSACFALAAFAFVTTSVAQVSAASLPSNAQPEPLVIVAPEEDPIEVEEPVVVEDPFMIIPPLPGDDENVPPPPVEAEVETEVAPTVSIGVGNDNTPSNEGPAHESTVIGTFDVFGTAKDDNNDLSGWHFRIVREGESFGHSCGEALSSPENQGFGGCGYVYNRTVSVEVGADILDNDIIETIDSTLLADGRYYLILGAIDKEGNRTNADWTQDPFVIINIDNVKDEGEEPVDENPVIEEEQDNDSPSRRSGSRRSTSVRSGSVLGASTDNLPAMCTPYITQYLKLGAANDAEEVRKLETFLNEEMGTNLVVDGIFDQATFDAVSAFQLKYADKILKPWVDINMLESTQDSTGYVYKTTSWWINMMQCENADIAAPQLP